MFFYYNTKENNILGRIRNPLPTLCKRLNRIILVLLQLSESIPWRLWEKRKHSEYFRMHKITYLHWFAPTAIKMTIYRFRISAIISNSNLSISFERRLFHAKQSNIYHWFAIRYFILFYFQSEGLTHYSVYNIHLSDFFHNLFCFVREIQAKCFVRRWCVDISLHSIGFVLSPPSLSPSSTTTFIDRYYLDASTGIRT